MSKFIKVHRKLAGDHDEYQYRDTGPPVRWCAIDRIEQFGDAHSNKSDPSQMPRDGGWVALAGRETAIATVETGEEILALIKGEPEPFEPHGKVTTEAFLALKRQDGSAEKLRDLTLDEDTGGGVVNALDALGLEALLEGE